MYTLDPISPICEAEPMSKPETPLLPRISCLDRFFSVSCRGSTVATELRAGTTAFLATANNFVVNAHIMSHAGGEVMGISKLFEAFRGEIEGKSHEKAWNVREVLAST